MSTSFYIAAVYAARLAGDALHVATGISLIHPRSGCDIQDVAIASAQTQYPTSEGWADHYVRVAPLDGALVDTIAAEAGLVPQYGLVATMLQSCRIEPDIEDEP